MKQIALWVSSPFLTFYRLWYSHQQVPNKRRMKVNDCCECINVCRRTWTKFLGQVCLENSDCNRTEQDGWGCVLGLSDGWWVYSPPVMSQKIKQSSMTKSLCYNVGLCFKTSSEHFAGRLHTMSFIKMHCILKPFSFLYLTEVTGQQWIYVT